MKHAQKFFLLVVVFLLLFGSALPTSYAGAAPAPDGFRVSGRNLLDGNGNNFIMRGVSHAYVWYPQHNHSFAAIKAAGANAVRVVLAGGGRWTKTTTAELATLIGLCKTNKLICVLENHDTTGYGEDGAAVSLATAVNYWKDVKSALDGHERYIIINIGNEPYGNSNTSAWVTDTKNAITAMRAAGFRHTLMVDAPNWGQDWSGTMKNNAASIFDTDPDKNVVFSVHMYGVYDTAAEVRDYIAAFVNANLPLVIGEFGFNHSDGNPDEDTIMSEAQAKGIGYLGWSWSGNGGGVEYLDMVTAFDASRPTSWGTRIIDGANGLRATSIEASVYSGGTVTPTPTTVTPTATTVTPTPTTVTPTPTTVTPTPCGAACAGDGLKVQMVNSGTDNNQQSAFKLRVQNTSSSAKSGISMRVYFTTDGSEAASNYTLEKYYDQSGVATVSGPTQASGSIYYFTVSYGSASLAAGAAWEFHTAMHLKNWASTFAAVNDWWHGTGALPASYTDWASLPAYVGSSLAWGAEPGGVTPTPTSVTPTPTTVTPTPTIVTPTPTTITPTPTTVTPTPIPGACTVKYTPNPWSNGFTAEIKITNTSASAIQGWTLTWSFANGQQLTGGWNATLTQSGANISASNPASHWNGTIAANGGAATFGIQATHNGTNAVPTNFALNGTACAVAP